MWKLIIIVAVTLSKRHWDPCESASALKIYKNRGVEELQTKAENTSSVVLFCQPLVKVDLLVTQTRCLWGWCGWCSWWTFSSTPSSSPTWTAWGQARSLRNVHMHTLPTAESTSGTFQYFTYCTMYLLILHILTSWWIHIFNEQLHKYRIVEFIVSFYGC